MALFSKKQPDAPRRRRADSVKERAVDDDFSERYTFRRNRTLTGSVSSKVVSTNESNAELKSARVQAHDLARQRRQLGVVLILVIVGAAMPYGLISQFTAGAVVKAEDVSMRLDPIYEQTIQSYLTRQPIERLRFLLNVSG